MKMVFKVDQQAALRRGYNASTSTVTLDINPGDAIWTPEDLAYLANALVDGHKVEGAPFRLDWAFPQEKLPPEMRRPGMAFPLLKRPDVEGVIEALEIVRSAQKRCEEVIGQLRVEVDAEIENQLSAPDRREVREQRGRPTMFGYLSVSGVYEAAGVRRPATFAFASEELKARFEAREKELRQENEAARAALETSLEHELDAQEAAGLRLKSCLPDLVQARIENGHMSTEDARLLVCTHVRMDRGMTLADGTTISPSDLTHREYEQFLAHIKHAEEGQYDLMLEVEDREDEDEDEAKPGERVIWVRYGWKEPGIPGKVFGYLRL